MAARKTKTKKVKALRPKTLSGKRAKGVKGGATKSKVWDWIK